MKKIPSLFKRDYEGTRNVYDEIVPGAEWAAAGEGVATRKYDGTCCLIKGGQFFKRREIKAGRVTPPGWFAAEGPDMVTGKTMGWVPVGDGTEDRLHREGLANTLADAENALGTHVTRLPEGTYELVGPGVMQNDEEVESLRLIGHDDAEEYTDAPRTYEALKAWLATRDTEGIVWHHPDGRMVKIKKKDFGLSRKPSGAASA